MKRLKFSFAMVLLYIITFAASAMGYIGISNLFAKSNEIGAQVTLLDNLTNSLNAYENLFASGSVQIEDLTNLEKNISLNLDIKLDLNKEDLGASKFDGKFKLNMNNLDYQMDIKYLDNMAYVTYNGEKFYFKVNSLLDAINGLSGVVQIDLGGMMEGFDTSSLIGLLGQIQEEKVKGGIKLVVPLTDTNNAVVIVDDMYRVTSVDLKGFEFKGKKISVNLCAEHKAEPIQIEAEDVLDSTDLTNSLEIVSNMMELFKQTQFTGKLNFSSPDFNLKSNLMLDIQDLKNIKAKFVLNEEGIENSIVYDNSNLYARLKGLKISLSQSEILDLMKLIPNDNGALKTAKSDYENIINELKSFNIDAIMTLLKKVEKTETGYYLEVNNRLNLTFISNSNVFKGVVVKFDEYVLDISIEKFEVKENEFNVKKEEYTPISKVIEDVKVVSDIVKKDIFLSLNFEYDGIKADGYLEIQKNDIKIDVDLDIKNNLLNVKLKNNIVFVSMYGKTVSIPLSEIGNIVSFVKSNFAKYIPADILNVLDKLQNKDVNSLKDYLKEQMTSAKINLNSIFDILRKADLKIENNKYVISYDKYVLNMFILQDDLRLEMNNSKMKLNIQTTGKREVVVSADDIEISNVINFYNVLNKTIENKAINGNINLTYNKEKVAVKYFIDFTNGLKGLKMNFDLSYRGMSANVKYNEEIIYVSAMGIKIKLSVNEIETLINDINIRFNTNIKLPKKNSSNFETANFNLKEVLDAFIIENFSTSNLNVQVLKEYFISIVFDNTLKNIELKNTNISANVEVKGFEKLEFTSSDFENYNNYKLILDYLDIAQNFLQQRKFDIKANAQITDGVNVKNNFNANVVADLTNHIKLGVFAKIDNKFDLRLSIENDYLYVNYNKLKLACHLNNLSEILYIILPLMNVDPATIPFLDKISADMENQIPNMNLQTPTDPAEILGYLVLIKNITISSNGLEVVLDNKIINEKASGDMYVNVRIDNKKISRIDVQNVYTSSVNQEYLSGSIIFGEFIEYKPLPNLQDYIDISSSSEFLKAGINTLNLKDFNISFNLAVKINVIGININWDIPVTANIKVLNGSPVLQARIGEIPIIGGVNNDAPTKFGDGVGGKNRYLNIYYKDKILYFHRQENIALSGRNYERKFAISVDEFGRDPLKYICKYGIGFSDTIMAQIYKSIASAMNRTTPIDPSNVLLGYKFIPANNEYNVLLNMKEISNDPNMDQLLLHIFLNNIQNKKYISKLAFDLSIVPANGVSIYLATNNMTLNNIGKEINISKALDYVNSYKYKENEFWEITANGWANSNSIKYTINFEENGGDNLLNITALPNQEISLPTPNKNIFDDGNVKIEYVFDGWWTTGNYEAGTRFENGTMPRKDLNLFAKWIEKKQYYRTITFNENGGQEVKDIKVLAGTNISLPTYENRKEVSNNITTTYKFLGWKNKSGEFVNYSKMPDENITLIAEWKVISVEQTRNLKVMHFNDVVFEDTFKEGAKIELPDKTKFNEFTKYFLDIDLRNEYILDVMPDQDLTLYYINRYKVTLRSDYGEFSIKETYYYENEIVSLPTLVENTQDDGKMRIDFTFNGFRDATGQIIQNYRVVVGDVEFMADWEVLSRKYLTITFRLDWYTPFGWVSNGTQKQAPTPIAPITVLQGDNVDLSKYNSTCVYKYLGTKTFNIAGWAYDRPFDCSAEKGFKNISNIQNSVTLYACWQRV